MGFLYKDHVEASSTLFSVLMCCFFAISTTYIFGTLLTANGNLKQLNIMAGAGMMLNIVLNLVLIPRWEAGGAAVASLATQSVTALIQIGLCYKVFRLKPDIPFVAKLLSFMLLTFVATWGLKSYVSEWITAIACAVMFAVFIAFLLRLLNWGAFMTLLRNRD
jgi:O-antigen/teichoic acid export membrane protein